MADFAGVPGMAGTTGVVRPGDCGRATRGAATSGPRARSTTWQPKGITSDPPARGDVATADAVGVAAVDRGDEGEADGCILLEKVLLTPWPIGIVCRCRCEMGTPTSRSGGGGGDLKSPSGGAITWVMMPDGCTRNAKLPFGLAEPGLFGSNVLSSDLDSDLDRRVPSRVSRDGLSTIGTLALASSTRCCQPVSIE